MTQTITPIRHEVVLGLKMQRQNLGNPPTLRWLNWQRCVLNEDKHCAAIVFSSRGVAQSQLNRSWRKLFKKMEKATALSYERETMALSTIPKRQCQRREGKLPNISNKRLFATIFLYPHRGYSLMADSYVAWQKSPSILPNMPALQINCKLSCLHIIAENVPAL